LLDLPLDKLIQSTNPTAVLNESQTAAGRPANNAEQVAPQAAPSVVAEPALREPMRNRDREAR